MKLLFLLALGAMAGATARAQSVGIGTTTPNSSAALDVTSTNKAFLPPRMSWAQIQAIPNPTGGMMVYDNNARGIRFYNGSSWVLMAPRQQSLADAPGTFSSVPVSGTASLYWYYNPSGRTKIGADGSLYFVAAVGSGTVNFGNTAITSTGGYSIAIAKLDSLGAPLWMKSIGSAAGFDITVHDLDVDASGNVYVCGGFSGTVDFNPGASINNLVSAGNYDGFLAKYDASGNYVWAQRYGGAGSETIKSICTDGSILYICGDHSSAFTYGSSSAPLSGSGQNIFLARAQASDGLPGASGWIRTAYCTSNNTATSMRVKLYSGSVLWGGNFNTTLTFSTGGYTKTTAGQQDCFYALYNSFGGTSTSNIIPLGGPSTEYFYDMATSIDGNIYVCGITSGNISLGGCSLSGAGPNSNGFIAVHNSSLACQNAYRFGGTTGFDACYALAVDNAGNVYVGGTSSSTDKSILGRNPAVGTSNSVAYLLKLSPTLYPLWFQLADGGSAYYADYTNGVAVSPDGKTVFSTVSAGQTDGIIGFDGQRVPSPNYFYISLYKE